MFKKEKKPYEYITKDNFDIIREIIMQGLHSKDPKAMVDKMVSMTNIPFEAAQAIVSQEIGEVFDNYVRDRDG